VSERAYLRQAALSFICAITDPNRANCLSSGCDLALFLSLLVGSQLDRKRPNHQDITASGAHEDLVLGRRLGSKTM
jgi:hypothetical protein